MGGRDATALFPRHKMRGCLSNQMAIVLKCWSSANSFPCAKSQSRTVMSSEAETASRASSVIAEWYTLSRWPRRT